MPLTNNLTVNSPLCRAGSLENLSSIDTSTLTKGMAFAVHMDAVSDHKYGHGVFLGPDKGFWMLGVTLIRDSSTGAQVFFSKSPVSHFPHPDTRRRCFLQAVSEQDWMKFKKDIPLVIMEMCGGETIPNCSGCNAAFQTDHEKKAHKCQCAKCGHNFKRHSDYSNHILLCGQIPNCPGCNVSFATLGEQKDHKCQCPYCPQTFKRKPDYKIHVEKCSGAEALFMRNERNRRTGVISLHELAVTEDPYTHNEVLGAIRTWPIGQCFFIKFVMAEETDIEENHGHLLRWDNNHETPVFVYHDAEEEEEDIINCIKNGTFSVFGLITNNNKKRSLEEKLSEAKKKIKVLTKENIELRGTVKDAISALRAVGCHELADSLI